MRTAFTEVLGIEHPIAVGGHGPRRPGPARRRGERSRRRSGCLGGVSYLPDDLREEIGPIRRATDRPFAVNLLVPPSLVDADSASRGRRWRSAGSPCRRPTGSELRGVEAMLTAGAVQSQVEVVLDERPAAVVLTFDVPRWFIDELPRARHQGDGAGRFGAAGAAGGGGRRRSSSSPRGRRAAATPATSARWRCCPAVVDAVDMPVLAAGGIIDGRGLAAARCLGAAGVVDGDPVHRQRGGVRPSRLQAAGGGGDQPGHGDQPLRTRGSRCERWRTTGPVRGRIAPTRSSPSRPSTRSPG